MYEKKKKAVVPRLRFPEFRDAGEWEVKRLGNEEISQFIRDRILPENIPIGHYVSTINLLPDFGRLATEPETPPPNNAVAYREGDILISNIRPYLKKVWIADRSGGASNDVLVVRAGKDIVSAYLSHLLMSDQFIAHVMEGVKGVKMPRGDQEQIQDFRVSVPPKPDEQQKIADCLASLDDLIRAGEVQLVALKGHKKGLMQQLFPREGETTPRLRFPEFRDAGEWEVKRLGEVADVYQPETISQSNLSKNGKYLVYGANGIIGRFDSYNHENSQIAITCRGSTCGEVTLTEPQSWITGNSMVVNLDKHQEVKKLFLYQQFVITDCKYLITGSGQPQITGEIKNHKVVLPSLQEQQKIADCLASLDDLIRAGEAQLVALKDHKKGLMQQLFPQEVG